jgi:hypothetical protein
LTQFRIQKNPMTMGSDSQLNSNGIGDLLNFYAFFDVVRR